MHTEHASPLTLSDQEIEQRVIAALRKHQVPTLRNVEVEARDGRVVLRGQVTSFYAKQLSHSSARRIAGSERVNDLVSVRSENSPHVRRRAAAFAALALLTALASGCSQSEPPRLPVHPVSGKVTYQGRPAAGAWVVFHPKQSEPNAPAPRAKVDDGGNFTLSTYEPQDGAPPGDYSVTLEWRKTIKVGGEAEPGPNLLPAKYASPKTTNVVVRVAEGANSVPIVVR